MESYFALLLLVMPGYLARLINSHLTNEMKETDKFRIVMESMLYNVFILPAIYAILYCYNPMVENIQQFFTAPVNIGLYLACMLGVSILLGAAWSKLKPVYTWSINCIRRWRGKNDIAISKLLFDIKFDDGEIHFVEVYRDEKLLGRGILSNMYAENGELFLVNAENVIKTSFAQYESSPEYKGIYLDYKNNLIVKELAVQSYEPHE